MLAEKKAKNHDFNSFYFFIPKNLKTQPKFFNFLTKIS